MSRLVARTIPTHRTRPPYPPQVFPPLLRAAGTKPSEPLHMLVLHGYQLYVGLGEGVGGGRQAGSLRAALGLPRCQPAHLAFALPNSSIDAFVELVQDHVDVLAQRITPAVPRTLDLRSADSVLYGMGGRGGRSRGDGGGGAARHDLGHGAAQTQAGRT